MKPARHLTRDFTIFMLVALSLLTVVALRRGVTLPLAIVPGACGGVLALVAVVRPTVVRPIAQGWAWIGHVLGRVTTPIVLAVVFAVVVVPLGLLMRVFGQDLLRLRRDPSAPTYWIERKKRTFDPNDFERLS